MSEEFDFSTGLPSSEMSQYLQLYLDETSEQLDALVESLLVLEAQPTDAEQLLDVVTRTKSSLDVFLPWARLEPTTLDQKVELLRSFRGRFDLGQDFAYGVFLPSGTTSTNGSSRSCTSYCGYHSSYTYNGKTILYAVLPYNNCSGCSISGKTVLDMMTIVTSHEIRETITDPVNAWWETSSGYEADDKCAWHGLYQQTGGAWVQPEYSNALAGWPRGCVAP